MSLQCDRIGRVRALWCTLTRKHGGTARGSHSWAEGSFLAPRRGNVVLDLVLTNIEEHRMILRCWARPHYYSQCLNCTGLKGVHFLSNAPQALICEDRTNWQAAWRQKCAQINKENVNAVFVGLLIEQRLWIWISISMAVLTKSIQDGHCRESRCDDPVTSWLYIQHLLLYLYVS